MTTMHICLMGVRGSLPIHTEAMRGYGGATSCVLVKTSDETVILDAGTGLHSADLASCGHFTLLISHPHADHLMGFPMLPALFDPDRSIDVYLKSRGGLDARAQLKALMSPPLWPIDTSKIRADIRYHEPTDRFCVGDVTIEALEVRHPGSSTAYKLTKNAVSLVYATDFEIVGDEPEFVEFAADCDLLLLDAQYTEDEYIRTHGFGHSTIDRSIALSERCRAKQTIFIHHDPSRTDKTLSQLDLEISTAHPSIHFGREGEEVFI